MERSWVAGRLVLTMTVVDFLDPALAGVPDARERGVRLEVRLTESSTSGSVYSSPAATVHPAVCRVDMLESAPHAADRMHWHPVMRDGEPGDRTMEASMGEDPAVWLQDFLHTLDPVLRRAGVGVDEDLLVDVRDLEVCAEEVVQAAVAGLARARTPWPEVEHDERGLARVAAG